MDNCRTANEFSIDFELFHIELLQYRRTNDQGGTMRDIGNAIIIASAILLAASYIWSFVLGWRKSALWFLVLVFLWVVFYPIFVAKNWKEAKANFMVFSSGLLLFAIAFVILAATNPYKAV